VSRVQLKAFTSGRHRKAPNLNRPVHSRRIIDWPNKEVNRCAEMNGMKISTGVFFASFVIDQLRPLPRSQGQEEDPPLSSSFRCSLMVCTHLAMNNKRAKTRLRHSEQEAGPAGIMAVAAASHDLRVLLLFRLGSSAVWQQQKKATDGGQRGEETRYGSL
jgi:hypothetical protein